MKQMIATGKNSKFEIRNSKRFSVSNFEFRASCFSSRPGFVLLISILAIGVIASVIISTLLLLGTSAGTFSLSVQQSSQAMALAQACGEYALRQLRNDPAYTGNQIRTIGSGTCEILPVGGIGNNNRLVCVEGQIGDVFRRMEIIVPEILPQTKIASWQEVSLFTLCQ